MKNENLENMKELYNHFDKTKKEVEIKYEQEKQKRNDILNSVKLAQNTTTESFVQALNSQEKNFEFRQMKLKYLNEALNEAISKNDLEQINLISKQIIIFSKNNI